MQMLAFSTATADLGAGIGGPWTPSALGAPMNLWLDASDASTIGGLGWTAQHLTGDADSKISNNEVLHMLKLMLMDPIKPSMA